MRTTVRLDDHLFTAAKRYAAKTGQTLTEVLSDALREVLARKRRGEDAACVRLPTFKGQGLQAGIDLDRTAALLDVMDAAE